MSESILTDEQREALQEITNIGMGQAGASIATILGEFVHLSIPNIHILRADDIPQGIVKLVGPGDVSAVRQAFHGSFRGEAIVIFRDQSPKQIADLMGYDPDMAEEYELILDIANVLVGACMGGIAEQIKADVGFSAPSIMAEHTPADRLIAASEVGPSYALFVEVNFALEGRSFACHLIALMPEDEILVLGKALDRFMESF